MDTLNELKYDYINKVVNIFSILYKYNYRNNDFNNLDQYAKDRIDRQLIDLTNAKKESRNGVWEKWTYQKYITLQLSYLTMKQLRIFMWTNWASLLSEKTTAPSVKTGSWIFVLTSAKVIWCVGFFYWTEICLLHRTLNG